MNSTSTNIHPSVFSLLLEALGVPYTRRYSERRFTTMPFHTMFGLTRLLDEYGIESQGIRLDDRSQVHSLPVPFMAQMTDGFTVVTSLGSASVEVAAEQGHSSMPLADFMQPWSGVALLTAPRRGASEPGYRLHRITETGHKVMRWLMALSALFLIVYAFVANGIYRIPAAYLIALFDMAGLYVSYLLIVKSLRRESVAADRFCGALQPHGCDHVLRQSAARFYGLFGWSEVGAAYFTVSLVALLAFPSALPWLALFNLCCLPFSFWSVWYQHYRAHAWCTLCLTVQALLWLLAISYLPLRWWMHLSLPLWTPAALGAAYLFALLAYNRVAELLAPDDDDDDDDLVDNQ